MSTKLPSQVGEILLQSALLQPSDSIGKPSKAQVFEFEEILETIFRAFATEA